MRRTESGDRINELKSKAARLDKEARTLRKVQNMDAGATERRIEAENLRSKIEELKPQRRLEAITVFKVEKTKTTAKGETRRYEFWYSSWKEQGKSRSVYLGSCKKLTE